MPLTGAERQRLYRERRAKDEPVRRYVDVVKTKRRGPSRPRVWTDAVEMLQELQQEYRDWYENMPEPLKSSALGEKLEAICELDLDELASIDPPLGYGRD